MRTRRFAGVCAFVAFVVWGGACRGPGDEDVDGRAGDVAVSVDAQESGGAERQTRQVGDAGRVADGRGDGETASGPSCSAAMTSVVYWEAEPANTVQLEDVTGDGRADELVMEDRGEEANALVSSTGFEVTGIPGAFLRVMDADVDGDGNVDLLVGSPFAHQLHVFSGPVGSEPVAWSEADLRFSSTPSAASNQFGRAAVVADLNGDDVRDLLITAPGEGEEACVAQESPYVFFGPFESGAYTGADADVRLAGPEGICLGRNARCRRGLVELHAYKPPRCVVYELPLSGMEEPVVCI